jgi:cytosine/adenosine deaminase-related metal-dependent hydrolase
LGTDSLASNHSLSLLDELKTLAAHFPAIPTEEMLTWATSKGAAALQLEDTLGKLTPGTRPGIIQIDALTPDEKINKATRVTRWW